VVEDSFESEALLSAAQSFQLKIPQLFNKTRPFLHNKALPAKRKHHFIDYRHRTASIL
jgi:hypothetical protein